MRMCPKCGNEVIGDWTFCNKCGTKLEDTPVPAHIVENANQNDIPETEQASIGDISNNDVIKKCLKCGSEIVGDWTFCNKCGANIEENATVKTPMSFVNSAHNGKNILEQINNNSFDPEITIDESSTKLEQPYSYNTPNNFNEPNYSTSSAVIKNNTENKKSKSKSAKPIVIVSSILGVLLISVIILVVAVSNNKPKNIEYIPSAGNEVRNYDDGYDSNSEVVIDKISMPACENKSLSTVKAQLEELGLSVTEEYEFNNDVAKNYIISQSISKGSEISVGSSVLLVVSKGPDECPYDYEQKLTVTASKGSSYGDAVLYEWKNGDWSIIASYNATVGSNGIGTAREDVSNSPEGIHKLGVVLSAYDVSTNLDVYKATSKTGVVYDENSQYYNQIMEQSKVPSDVKFDRIGQGLTDGTTYATIYIEHNGNGFSSDNVRPGYGSAIGLRGQNGSLSPTYGDVDISANDMKDLLSKLDADKNPVIEIKTK